MNKMNEDEAIKRLQEILDFKKNTIDKIEDPTEREIEENCYIEEMPFKAIETILDLYKNAKYELKGKEALVDTMSHNEEVITRYYEMLEEKLRQEREKNKELENADLTKEKINGKAK